jgi:hypothetical protein
MRYIIWTQREIQTDPIRATQIDISQFMQGLEQSTTMTYSRLKQVS